uniref:CPBP family intramembrane glutamic endopeptidase n=1 Tax=Gluconobacter thailandicus TaxID=257438 RepID=UPI001E3D2BE0|nr:CPBP family intramembrane glutamic endopeptidase [Gluconobacter thailandicus]
MSPRILTSHHIFYSVTILRHSLDFPIWKMMTSLSILERQIFMAPFLLLVLLIACIHHSVQGSKDWKIFRNTSDTDKRQSFYRKWLFQSILLFDAGGLLSLHFLSNHPQWFPLTQLRLSPGGLHHSSPPTETSPAFLVGLACGIFFVISFFLLRRKLGRTSQTLTLGDFTALIPRTIPEAGLVLLLCVNAGFGEELFFRLTLPLLVKDIGGNLIAATVLSTLLFGGMHWYQGRKGVLATTIIGAFFTLRALNGTPLILLMGLHALMDVFALFVRPALTGHFSKTTVRP